MRLHLILKNSSALLQQTHIIGSLQYVSIIKVCKNMLQYLPFLFSPNVECPPGVP